MINYLCYSKDLKNSTLKTKTKKLHESKYILSAFLTLHKITNQNKTSNEEPLKIAHF